MQSKARVCRDALEPPAQDRGGSASVAVGECRVIEAAVDERVGELALAVLAGACRLNGFSHAPIAAFTLARSPWSISTARPNPSSAATARRRPSTE
jgi:hypothetical protein